MSDAYTVSPAQIHDVEELTALLNSAYRGDSSRVGWTTEADFLDGQRTEATAIAQQLREGLTILCLREGGSPAILGCVLLQVVESDRGRGFHLGMLTINPRRQAHGLGRKLLQSAEDFVVHQRGKWITLTVIQLRESLMEWYERRGYQRTDKTSPFPYGHPEKGLPKRDDLYFVWFEKFLPAKSNQKP